jgi:excisionase family DNA binding protein
MIERIKGKMDINLDNSINSLHGTRLLKADEIAAILNISRSFAYQLLQTGAIPVVRLGKACRVRPQDLEAFVEQNRLPQADNH